MKKSTRFVSCIDITSCPYGRNCGVCAYRDNLRSMSGFRLDEDESGTKDWCTRQPIGVDKDGWCVKSA